MVRLVTLLLEQLAELARAKRKPPRKHEEHSFQASLVAQLEALLPPNAVVFSVDHANAYSAATGANRKKRGVKSGIPDVWVLWNPEPEVHWLIAVVFETKAKGGRLSKEQKVWRETLEALGVHWGAPVTPEEAFAVIRRAGIPLRGRLA